METPGRPHALRARLVATVLVLLAVAFAVIGVTTTLALRQFLFGRLDREVGRRRATGSSRSRPGSLGADRRARSAARRATGRPRRRAARRHARARTVPRRRRRSAAGRSAAAAAAVERGAGGRRGRARRPAAPTAAPTTVDLPARRLPGGGRGRSDGTT